MPEIKAIWVCCVEHGPDDGFIIRLIPVWTDVNLGLLQVSRTAKMMVSQLGFSKLGQVAWQSGGGPSFVGQQAGQAPDCSGHTADLIDAEVKELVERSYRFVHQGICILHVQ